MLPLEYEPSPSSKILFEVDELTGDRDPNALLTYPTYSDIPDMHWAHLRLRPGPQTSEVLQANDRLRDLRFGEQGLLIGVLFFDPGLGIDITDLPLDDGLPSIDEFKDFFREHDIFLGRKTPEQIRQEFERYSVQWIQEAQNSEDPYRDPAYQKVLSLGPSVVPLILDRVVNYPTEEWRFALRHLAIVDPTGDEWNPHAERWKLVPQELARNAWINWGREKGYLSPQSPTQIFIPPPES